MFSTLIYIDRNINQTRGYNSKLGSGNDKIYIPEAVFPTKALKYQNYIKDKVESIKLSAVTQHENFHIDL